jgi:hypothetical protein
VVIVLLIGLTCLGAALLLALGVVADAAARRDGLQVPVTRLRTISLGLAVVGMVLLIPVIVTMT